MSARRRPADAASSAPAQPGYRMRGRQGHVIEAIGREIIRGRYEPGDLLPRESDLVDQYGASRTVIREAMKVLSAKGLVDIRPKVGTRVRSKDLWNTFDSDLLTWTYEEGQSADYLLDLLELRQILEPRAASLAASRATMDDLGRLDEAVASMAASADEAQAYAEHDVAFHLAVYTASHNAFLSRFGMLVADFMKLSFDLQQSASGLSLHEDASRHLAVVESISRNDAAAAAEAMLQVVIDGKSALAAALRRRPDAG